MTLTHQVPNSKNPWSFTMLRNYSPTSSWRGAYPTGASKNFYSPLSLYPITKRYSNDVQFFCEARGNGLL